MSPELILKLRNASSGISNTSLPLLVSEFIEYSRRNCSPSTLPARVSRIKRFQAFMTEAGISDISDINNSVLAIYFDEISTSPSSANASRMVVKSFINWIEGYKEISTPIKLSAIVPAKVPKRKPRYLLEKDVLKIILSQDIPYIDRLLVACAFRLGLRASELSNLKLSDIKDDRLTIIGKGNSERTIIIPQRVLTMLEVWKVNAPYRVDGYIFQSFWRGGWRKMTTMTIWRHIKLLFQQNLDVDISPHWLRRSYAVDLLLKGCDIITVQQSLGHTDLKVTQIYAQLATDDMSIQIHKYLG